MVGTIPPPESPKRLGSETRTISSVRRMDNQTNCAAPRHAALARLSVRENFEWEALVDSFLTGILLHDTRGLSSSSESTTKTDQNRRPNHCGLGPTCSGASPRVVGASDRDSIHEGSQSTTDEGS